MASFTAKYPRDERGEFFSVLRKRVSDYFKENNISKYGDYRMWIKTVVMLLMYFIPYALILMEVADTTFIKFLLWTSMGVGLAGIGLSVMHDAAHGAYSKNKRVNWFFSNVMTIIGGSVFTWNIQHNQLHHAFTNVDGIDEDIDPGVVMRFSPHKKRYFMHRFQHIYAWFLYGFMTVTWSTEKDFRQLFKYRREGNMDNGKINFTGLFSRMVINKIIFHFLTIGIPMLVLSDSWPMILLYAFSMHFVAGLIMACVFQPAHVMPTSEYPLPDSQNSLENNWAVHQLLTTANFSPDSNILSYYVGGLNHQIEHHLFPNICHVHYKEISKIVQKTAEEYGLPYNVQPTFLQALYHHARMLRDLGRYDTIPA